MIASADFGGVAPWLLLGAVLWAFIFFLPASKVSSASPGTSTPPPLDLPPSEAFPPGLTVRPYHPDDRSACLSIYASNAGEFVPTDAELFLRSIETEKGPYLVVQSGGHVIACGGITLRSAERDAWLWMGLVERTHHRRQLGTLLLLARLALLRDGSTVVALETTAKSEPLYARFGFTRASAPEERYPGGLSHFLHGSINDLRRTRSPQSIPPHHDRPFRVRL